jgi:tripartite-type tricarboxylate transporter receptor subunit TctC
VQFKYTRRRVLAMSVAASGFGSSVFAQTGRSVRLIVPFPAGGTADILPRILAEKVRASYPAGVIVDNRPGAGGNIGAVAAARANPDGATLLVSPPAPIAINHLLYKSLSFDPTKWVPITVLATVPSVLVVRKGFPAKDVQEFIDYLKANPGKVTYASQGNGTGSHLTAAMFMQLTGTEMIHVPYKGTMPAMTDLLGGQVDVIFDNVASSAPFHKGGKLTILAVADQRRSPLLPQVPTFIEAKVTGMVSLAFFSVVAPPGTPQEVVASTYKAFSAALALADVRQQYAEQGATPCGWSPDQTARFISDESARWAKVIKTANVTVE